MENSKSTTALLPGTTVPAVITLLVGVYVYWASQQELVSSRPYVPAQHDVPDPIPTPGTKAVYSRMWQDPLSTSFERWEEEKQSNPQLNVELKTVLDGEENRTDPPSLSERVENGIRSFWGPKKSDPWAERIKDMKKYFRLAVAQKNHTLILPVLVPGEPYAEDKETRMRIRYAVATAMAGAGFQLTFDTRMSYVVPKVFIRTQKGWQEQEIVVPVKLWRNGKVHTQVYVFWINEDQLGLRPLLALHRILNAVFSDVESPKKLSVKIVGPTNSGVLKIIHEESENIESGVVKLMRSLVNPVHLPIVLPLPLPNSSRVDSNSLSATIFVSQQVWEVAKLPSLTRRILPEAVDKQFKKFEHSLEWAISSYAPYQFQSGCAPLLDNKAALLFNRSKNDHANSDFVPIFSQYATADLQLKALYQNPLFRLKRVIGKDSNLIGPLIDELDHRGVNSGEIVLLGENSNEYVHQFKIALEAEAEAEASFRPRFKSYFEGLDGNLPGNDADKDRRGPIPKSSSDQSDSQPKHPSERLPEGRSQYDYLRRLAQDLKAGRELEPEEEKDGEKTRLPIRAIGVVGSDIYDKLLVLRTLKPQFPDAIFFTPDLDAIYTHQDELHHTQNLIIASHFGLTLNEGLQGSAPPFRDSYQTATFLATRLALQEQVRWEREEYKNDDLKLGDNNEKWDELLDEYWGPHGWKENKSDDGNSIDSQSKEPSSTDSEWKGPEPLLFVVGNESFQQLNQPDGRVSTAVQPQRTFDMKGRHFLYIMVVMGLATFGGYVYSQRDELLKSSVLLKRLCPTDDRLLTTQLVRFFHIGFPALFLFGLGILLVMLLMLPAAMDFEPFSLVGGYSIWPRCFVYVLTGLFASFFLFRLTDQILQNYCGLIRTDAAIGQFYLDSAQIRVFVMAILLSLAIIQGGTLFVFGTSRYYIWVSSSFVFLGIAVCLWLLDFPNPRTNRNFRCVWVTMGVIGFLTFLAAIWPSGSDVPIGWKPVWISRGSGSRAVEQLSAAFAYGSVAMLFTAILSTHIWCRYFLQVTKQYATWGSKRMVDQLKLAGQFTKVPAQISPVLIAMLLFLALAYYPTISPTPMPKGILVLLTLTLLFLIGSMVLLKRYVHEEREQCLRTIQEQILKQKCKATRNQAKSSFTYEQEEEEVYTDEVQVDSPDGVATSVKRSTHITQKQELDGEEIEPDHENHAHSAGQESKEDLELSQKEIENLNEGAFRPWHESHANWILGGTTVTALVQWWLQWFAIAV